jgi:sodium/hydrogen antiporter
MTHANSYIAAFVAGAVLATVTPRAAEAFTPSADLVSELAKDAALLVFATLITPGLLRSVGVAGWIVAAMTLLVARPLPVLGSLIGSTLPQAQRWAAAWFGPKGFASLVYTLILLEGGYPHAAELFAVVAVTVLLSIVAHGSTDTLVAQRLARSSGPGGRGMTPVAR